MVSEDNAERPWLLFHIAGENPQGVDARDLAQLLHDMAGAARAIAREKLSLRQRPGRMSAMERSLAAFRVVSVSPGSLDITLAEPPPVDAKQAAMRVEDEVTPEAVARELIQELEAASTNIAPLLHSDGRRVAAERVVRSAARMGDFVEIVHYPVDGKEFRSSFVLLSDSAGMREPPRESHRRIMFGQVFMADVEAGRQRVRVKLPRGSDLTMAIDDALTDTMPTVLGELTELSVSETIVGTTVVDRIVDDIRLLPAEERGIERPEKSIHELAMEQGLLLRAPPDYFSILSSLWDTEEEAEAFRDDIRRGRSASR